MTYGPILASLLAVDLAAAMSPGPNFVLVSQAAVDRDRRTALAVVGGFALSNLLWCVAVMLGLAALFHVVPQAYVAIRVIGGFSSFSLGFSFGGRVINQSSEIPASTPVQSLGRSCAER